MIERLRGVMRWIMAAFYAVAGIGHLLRPEAFLPIVPDWVPLPREVILATGIDGPPGHRRAKPTPSFGRLCPGVTV